MSTPVLRPRNFELLHLFLLSFTIVYVLCCVMLAVDKSFFKRIWWWWCFFVVRNKHVVSWRDDSGGIWAWATMRACVRVWCASSWTRAIVSAVAGNYQAPTPRQDATRSGDTTASASRPTPNLRCYSEIPTSPRCAPSDWAASRSTECTYSSVTTATTNSVVEKTNQYQCRY